jgi:Cytochrome c oxidase subunit IV
MTEPVVPVEGPAGHEAGRTDDRTVPRRVFLGIGVLLGVYALIYASTAYEEAGTVMLALSAVLALWFGTYLWLGQRARTSPVPLEPVEEVEEYLPHASVWPFVIGIGAATVFNGLVLGIWVIVPGLFVMAIGIGGWIGQTRRRD